MNTCGQNYKFTGLERDAETGNNPTPNRMYNSQYGRWLSPDPLAGDITNPQSLNRYAYVLNNPTNLTDPDGLCPEGQRCGPEYDPSTCDGIACGDNGTSTNPFNPCSYLISNDASCQQAAGLYNNGQPIRPGVSVSLGGAIGGGGGSGAGPSGPLSGDYGAGLPPPSLGLGDILGIPQPQFGCEFGSCAGGVLPGEAWRSPIGLGPSGYYALLPGTNYCGPGDRGYDRAPLNGVDTACMWHDLAYDRAGITSFNYFHLVPMTPQQKAAKAAADQQLCRDLANNPIDTENPTAADLQQITQQTVVGNWFGCH